MPPLDGRKVPALTALSLLLFRLWPTDMWKSFRCTTGTGRSGYMGFQSNYDSVLAYLLAGPDGPYMGYNDLVWINGNAFDGQYALIRQRVDEMKCTQQVKPDLPSGDKRSRTTTTGNVGRIRLAEPRELLNLLNYVETHDTRFSYVPRPFHRSNIFSLTSLVRLNESSVIGCIFCGKKAAYALSNRSVCFTTLSLVGHVHLQKSSYLTWDITVPLSAIGGPMYENELDPENRRPVFKPVFEEARHLHHDCCPVVWLHDKDNAVWNDKDAVFVLRGVSKFQHMMQFITTYPRPREEWVWLSLANRLGHCVSPGAMQHTIENLLRIICNERLRLSVDLLYTDVDNRWRAPSAARRPPPPLRHDAVEKVRYDPGSPYATVSSAKPEFHREPMHVNSFVYHIIDLSDDNPVFDGQYGYRLADLVAPNVLPFGGSCTVIPPLGEEPVSVRINKWLNKSHRAERSPLPKAVAGASSREDDVSGAFGDGTVTSLYFHRLLFLQGYLIRRKGPAFDTVPGVDSKGQSTASAYVCLYCCATFSNVLFNYENSFTYYTPAQMNRLLRYALYGCAVETRQQLVYGRWLTSVPYFPATFFRDLNSRVLPKHMKNVHKRDHRLQRALVWLSSSLDSSHRDECVFRIKKQVFNCAECRICLNECDEPYCRVMMTCGHWFCRDCYNEIAMTDCSLCRTGYRTGPITVSDSVLRGYAESKHFCKEIK